MAPAHWEERSLQVGGAGVVGAGEVGAVKQEWEAPRQSADISMHGDGESGAGGREGGGGKELHGGGESGGGGRWGDAWRR